MCADIVGAMSRTRLGGIMNRFLQELDARLRADSSSARPEILQLCESMKTVKLLTTSTEQARAVATPQ